MSGGRPLRVLLTAFGPFGGEPVNPSERIARALAAEPPPPGLRLAVEILPVDRTLHRAALAAAVERHAPDVALGAGQAAGRPRVDLEARACNRLDYRGELDNGGHGARDECLEPGGPAQLDATLPLARLAAELRLDGHPVALSLDAGRHLCNATLYRLLHGHASIPAAFVHLPLLPEQARRRGRGEPALAEELSRSCLRSLLAALPAHVRGAG